jgi:hypothetical protein
MEFLQYQFLEKNISGNQIAVEENLALHFWTKSSWLASSLGSLMARLVGKYYQTKPKF